MLAYVFVLLAIVMRLVAGTGYFSLMGFTPLGASLLFFGAHAPRKQFIVPVTLLMGTDLYLLFVKYHASFTWDQVLIWTWYIGACFIGLLLKNRIKPLRVASAALASAVSFFLISNFGVWAVGYVGYPKTLPGLAAAYVAAIPFFERGLVSDLGFSAVFFSLPVLIAMSRRVWAGTAHKDAAV